ncbi:response regulator transcription factor [Clostridium gasigenes]|uniref:response regulator transcription factor n=1 Tax=Clostridium gasigenes TaxID=94869 RepID=UPI001C0AFEB4|nr:response regulator transcription factor [Clostridium gasigenes]MBU3109195.1 response regulator transcription factor [Clostridium gasigenes]
MRNILIIEDEVNISDFIKMELEYEGYNAKVCEDGKIGLREAIDGDYDLIILDLMLPTLSGLEVCRRLKREKDIPVIMLSAKDSVMDKVAGLQIGADDYLAKPFDIEELLARIQVVFRREEKVSMEKIRFKDIIIDRGSRTVIKDSIKLNLTNKEYELLILLINNKNKVVSRDVILDKVWGYDYDAGTNGIDVYVSYLRNKLNQNDKEEYIQTVRAVGYIMRL